MKQVTKWWVTPVDTNGNYRKVYDCDTLGEAIAIRERQERYHPEAVEWILEKVTRNYRDDGCFEFKVTRKQSF